MKLLATGDIHFGSGQHIPGRLEEQEAVWRRILMLARQEVCAAVLVAGDVFERRNPSAGEILAFERPLVEHRDESHAPVIVVSGDHDTVNLDTASALDVLAEAGLIDLHRRPGHHAVTVGTVGDTIGVVVTLPYAPVHRLVAASESPDRAETNRLAAELLLETARGELAGVREVWPDTPAVLLTHFAISGAVLQNDMSVDGPDFGVVLPATELDQLGFELVVAGHVHRGGSVPGTDRVIYVGSPMPCNHGEEDFEHGVFMLELA